MALPPIYVPKYKMCRKWKIWQNKQKGKQQQRSNNLTKNASLSTSNQEKTVEVEWQGQLESRFSFQVSYK